MDGEGRPMHNPVLEKACRRIQGQRADAEDVAKESLLLAFRALPAMGQERSSHESTRIPQIKIRADSWLASQFAATESFTHFSYEHTA
jgi:hypothetical protein